MTLDRTVSAQEVPEAPDCSVRRSASVGTSTGARVFGGALRWLAASLLAILLAGGCDRPFEPVPENQEGPFWIFGYLDVMADTQWIRVMPLRKTLLTNPDPIDALVTLENVNGGPTVTLNDSLVRFTDERLGSTAYAHNFWTTERLKPEGRYRIRAERSNGDSTIATVQMPAALSFSFLNLEGGGDTARVEVRAERVLFVEMIHGMMNLAGEPAGVIVKRQPAVQSTGDPGIQALDIDESPPFQLGLVEIGRAELRIASARADWITDPQLWDIDVTLSDSMPSNVRNGFGFVGGVATWTIPFHRCTVVVSSPGARHPCTVNYDARSASVAGRVVQQPCGKPYRLADVRLTETFADDAAVSLSWKTGWDGTYRFEGLEPGADLVLDLGPGTAATSLPRLAPGQRYAMQELVVGSGC